MAYVFYKGTPASFAECMYQLKELLKTAGWTVQSSSDGTTYNASGDQITSGGSGAGGMANTNAWFRIRSPAGASNPEFTVQRGTGNTAWRVKFSQSNAFTGGSPGATQTPSATNERVDFGGGYRRFPNLWNALWGN